MTILMVGMLFLSSIAGGIGLIWAWRSHKKLAQLEQQTNERLNMFLETSITVAQCVDRLALEVGSVDIKSRVDQAQSPRPASRANTQHRSRAWILGEIQARLLDDTKIQDIVDEFDLNSDERLLLRIARRRGATEHKMPGQDKLGESMPAGRERLGTADSVKVDLGENLTKRTAKERISGSLGKIKQAS